MPKKGGFTLSAQFTQVRTNLVEVSLTVDALDSSSVALGDSAWFCLHPTFNPDWVKIYFDNGRATLTVKTWGGFTVGAWLPRQGVELELDLARIPDAPKIIRER
jgi:hypothetical protein